MNATTYFDPSQLRDMATRAADERQSNVGRNISVECAPVCLGDGSPEQAM